MFSRNFVDSEWETNSDSEGSKTACSTPRYRCVHAEQEFHNLNLSLRDVGILRTEGVPPGPAPAQPGATLDKLLHRA